jgi:hypothetical protein
MAPRSSKGIVESEPLPPLYAGWVGDLLGGPIPREADATCGECAMCPSDGPPPGESELFFDPWSKCCTYTPDLVNYLVGRVLQGGETAGAAGRATLEARLDTGVGVTPLGLARSSAAEVLYGHVARLGTFGRAPALRCPHFLEEERGRCGIWSGRNAVCATWFCKHVRGVAGYVFWRSLLRLLIEIERELAAWCVEQLDVGAPALGRLFPPLGTPSAAERLRHDDLDGPVDEEFRRALWGRWAGRERAFYVECARRVGVLSWTDLTTICGPRVRVLVEPVRAAYATLLSEETPDALRVGPFRIVGQGPRGPRIAGYSPMDPVELPRELVGALHHFEGRSTREALAVIAARERLRLSRGLVRSLVDQAILVPARAPVALPGASLPPRRRQPPSRITRR